MSLCCLFFHICQSRTRQNRTSECLSYCSNFVIHFDLINWWREIHTNHRNQHDHIVAPLNFALDTYILKYPSQTISATFEMLPKHVTNALSGIYEQHVHTILTYCVVEVGWLRGTGGKRGREQPANQCKWTHATKEVCWSAIETGSAGSVMPLTQMFAASWSECWPREDKTHRAEWFLLCHSFHKVRRRRGVRQWPPS